eukprot:jgi/Botrbrau1/3794/Bobra.0183s0027.1
MAYQGAGAAAGGVDLPLEGRSTIRRINGTVLGVASIFAFIYFTVVACVIIPWLSYSVPGVLNLACITLTTLLAFGTFLTCVISDPGSVPFDYVPDPELTGAVLEVKRKSGQVRYCQKCGKHKPPRCHHCRVCRRCVLRMDHHCPWINNCVGHANYKSFILFLIYVNAAVLHALGLLGAHALYLLRMHSEQRSHTVRTGLSGTAGSHQFLWAALQTVCTAVTLPIAIGLFMLLVWNLYLISSNLTTIEYHEGVSACIQAARSGKSHRHPYNLGLYGNVSSICGPRPHTWLLPFWKSAFGDGLMFPTYLDDDGDIFLTGRRL